MNILLCLILGYLPGCLNPASVLARINGIDLRQRGTGNLGATNVMLNLGKAAGVFVMLFDTSKAYAAYCIAQRLFPGLRYAGLYAGCAAVAGHIFPFQLHFRGGKGFASLCGLMLAHEPVVAAALLCFGLVLMILTNVSITLQLAVILLFPAFSGIRSGSAEVFLLTGAACALVLVRHRENFAAVFSGGGIRVRDFIREHFSGRRM